MNKNLKALFADDPEMLRSLDAKEQAELLRQLLDKKTGTENLGYLKGEKGEDGLTPTEEELKAIILPLIPEPIPGQDGESIIGPQGPIGPVGPRGRDSDTPGPKGEKGDPGDKGDKGKDGEDTTIEDVIKELKKKQYLEPKDIKGLPINMNDMRWHGGGLSTVSHDNTLTGLGTPSSPLSVVGGGGGSPGGDNLSIQFNDNGVFNGFGSFDGTYLSLPNGLAFQGQYTNLNGSAYINPDGSAVFATGGAVITNSGASSWKGLMSLDSDSGYGQISFANSATVADIGGIGIEGATPIIVGSSVGDLSIWAEENINFSATSGADIQMRILSTGTVDVTSGLNAGSINSESSINATTGYFLNNSLWTPPIVIGSTAVTGGQANRVLWEGATHVVNESSGLTYINDYEALGVGTGAPEAAVHSFGVTLTINGLNDYQVTQGTGSLYAPTDPAANLGDDDTSSYTAGDTIDYQIIPYNNSAQFAVVYTSLSTTIEVDGEYVSINFAQDDTGRDTIAGYVLLRQVNGGGFNDGVDIGLAHFNDEGDFSSPAWGPIDTSNQVPDFIANGSHGVRDYTGYGANFTIGGGTGYISEDVFPAEFPGDDSSGLPYQIHHVLTTSNPSAESVNESSLAVFNKDFYEDNTGTTFAQTPVYTPNVYLVPAGRFDGAALSLTDSPTLQMRQQLSGEFYSRFDIFGGDNNLLSYLEQTDDDHFRLKTLGNYLSLQAANNVSFVLGTTNVLTVGPSSLIFNDGYNIFLGSTSGTQIGTATTQKMSFYGGTPIVQPTGVTVATAMKNLRLMASSFLPASIGEGGTNNGSGLTTNSVVVYDGSKYTGTSAITYASGRLSPGYVTLAAGTATSNTAPLVFTSGTLLTSAIAGAVEFLTDKFYGTITTGAARKELALVDSAMTTGQVVTTTTNGRIQSVATLGVALGGTNIASYAVGDIIYASGSTTLSKLADVATGNALISGGVTTAPSWGKIGLTTHVSGTLPVANGGTGQTTPVAIAASVSTTGTATTTFTVTIGTTQANATYKVNVTPTSLVAAAVFYVNNKTTTTFDVVYLAGLTGAVSFDWALFT